MKKLFTVAVLVLASAGTSMAALIVLFSNNFDTETLDLNAVPSRWTVAGGTVDIIGAVGFFDFLPGNERYIDLDGTSQTAGVMTTVATFNLLPGYTYTPQFDLAGNQGGGNPPAASLSDTVLVTLGSSLSARLSFDNTDRGENIGPLLDNVLLTTVATIPAPRCCAARQLACWTCWLASSAAGIVSFSCGGAGF